MAKLYRILLIPSACQAARHSSPEGHYLQFGEHGELIALTIVNARRFLEQDGKIVVSLPDGSRLETSDLGPALAAA